MNDISTEITLSPLWTILLGCMTVIVLVFAIIGWQIHRVMRVNPAKIIAKE